MSRSHLLLREQRIEQPLSVVFPFFAEAQNLEALTPPFLRFEILTPLPIEMRVGARIEYRLRLGGVPLRWRTRITEWQPGVRFVDEQESGPYALWRHTHEFEQEGGATLMRDRVEYRVGWWWFGEAAHAVFVGRALNSIFDYRRERVAHLLCR